MDIIKILHSIYFFLFSGSLIYITYLVCKFFWYFNMETPQVINLSNKEQIITWISFTILFVSMIKGIVV